MKGGDFWIVAGMYITPYDLKKIRKKLLLVKKYILLIHIYYYSKKYII
jgi:hypothetical protein